MPLSPTLRRCSACGEQPTTFARRPELIQPAVPVASSRPPARGHYSRWKRSPTTFGPAGRLTITIVVVVVPLAMLFTPYFIGGAVGVLVAPLILREVWRPGWTVPGEDTGGTGDPPTAPAAVTPPTSHGVREPLPVSTFIAWTVGGVLIGAAALAWQVGGNVTKAVTGIVASLTFLVVFLAWSLKS